MLCGGDDNKAVIMVVGRVHWRSKDGVVNNFFDDVATL